MSLPLNSASTAAAIRYPGKAKWANLTHGRCHAVLMGGLLSAIASSPTFHPGHVRLLNICLIPAWKLFENLGSNFWLLLTTSTVSDMQCYLTLVCAKTQAPLEQWKQHQRPLQSWRCQREVEFEQEKEDSFPASPWCQPFIKSVKQRWVRTSAESSRRFLEVL